MKTHTHTKKQWILLNSDVAHFVCLRGFVCNRRRRYQCTTGGRLHLAIFTSRHTLYLCGSSSLFKYFWNSQVYNTVLIFLQVCLIIISRSKRAISKCNPDADAMPSFRAVVPVQCHPNAIQNHMKYLWFLLMLKEWSHLIMSVNTYLNI